MAVHDYEISDGSGSAVLNDINDCLDAILSNNSNTTAPSTTVAGMLWYDTTNSEMYMRNSSDSGWVAIANNSGLYSDSDAQIDNEMQLGTGTSFDASAWDVFGDNFNHYGARPRYVMEGSTDVGVVWIDTAASVDQKVFAIVNDGAMVKFSRWDDDGLAQTELFQVDLANNYLLMPNLPTSTPGGSGRLWNDTGTVKIT